VLFGPVHTDSYGIWGAAEDGGGFCVSEALPHDKAQGISFSRSELIDGAKYGVGRGQPLIVDRRRRRLLLQSFDELAAAEAGSALVGQYPVCHPVEPKEIRGRLWHVVQPPPGNGEHVCDDVWDFKSRRQAADGKSPDLGIVGPVERLEPGLPYLPILRFRHWCHPRLIHTQYMSESRKSFQGSELLRVLFPRRTTQRSASKSRRRLFFGTVVPRSPGYFGEE
jgi:hypothetical protein